MMDGIVVTLRDCQEAEGKPLCRVTFDQLNALLTELKRWRVKRENVDPTEEMEGQFVLNGAAYFEIIVGAD